MPFHIDPNATYRTFKDIPQFTKSSSYAVSVPWRSIDSTLKEFGSGPAGIDLDPEFQRGHVWRQDESWEPGSVHQQTDYVEFCLRGGRSGQDIHFNCPYWQSGNEHTGKMVLVDGKQRLNAVRRFLNNEIPAFNKFMFEYEGVLAYTAVSFTFHVNDLTTDLEVYDWYLSMNAGGTPHTPAELDRVRALMVRELEKQGAVTGAALTLDAEADAIVASQIVRRTGPR